MFDMHYASKKSNPALRRPGTPKETANFALGVLFYCTLYDFHSAQIPVSSNMWEHINK